MNFWDVSIFPWNMRNANREEMKAAAAVWNIKLTRTVLPAIVHTFAPAGSIVQMRYDSHTEHTRELCMSETVTALIVSY